MRFLKWSFWLLVLFGPVASVLINYQLAFGGFEESLRVYSKQYYYSGAGEARFIRIQGSKKLVVDNKARTVVLFDAEAELESFRDTSGFPDYGQKRALFTDREKNRGIFEKNAIVGNVTSADIRGDKIALSHVYFTGWFNVRYVQVLDSRLNVVSAFLDTIYLEHNEAFRDVVVFDTDSTLLATGEKGELLRYSLSGQMQHRYIINDKLFNTSRAVRPPHDTGVGAKSFINQATALISARDESVQGTSNLSLPDVLYLQDFTVGEAGRLLLLSDNRLYECDLGSGELVNKYNLRQVSGLRDYADDYERFLQVKWRKGKFCFLSSERFAELDRESSRAREHVLYGIVHPAPYDSWECVPQADGRVILYFFKPNETKVQSVGF